MRAIILKAVMLFSPCLFVVLVHGEAEKATTETLEATVVAYDTIKATNPCYRDCEGSLIVRIQAGGNQSMLYARIDFRFRNSSSFPRQLIVRKRLWRFSVTRTKLFDEEIYEYIVQKRTANSEEKKYPIWAMVPAAEDEKLPFGEVLPAYSLIRNDFKLIR